MIFKELSPQDFRVVPSVGEQTVEISQQDIANSANRRRYMTYYAATDVDPNDQPSDPVAAELVGTTRQVVTGTYQTVYDMDHTNQHANPLMDMSFGIYGGYEEGVGWTSYYLDSYFDGFDGRGKPLWKNGALQINEKIDVYRQMAQKLLGDPDKPFEIEQPSSTPGNPLTTTPIHHSLFLTFRRPLLRDGIQKGSFAMRIYHLLNRFIHGQPATGGRMVPHSIDPDMPYWSSGYASAVNSEKISTGELVISDTWFRDTEIPTWSGSAANLSFNTGSIFVGRIFYDAGVVILDVPAYVIVDDIMAGILSTLEDNGLEANYSSPSSSAAPPWDNLPGDPVGVAQDIDFEAMTDPFGGKVLPVSKKLFYTSYLDPVLGGYRFLMEASIDDIIDHIASTRFISDPDSDLTAITFKSKVRTQSMIIHCRVAPEDFNYSNNPTYTDEDGNIVARDSDTKPFSYVTKIVLLDASNRILATAALSRPLFNDSETDQSFRIRLDY